MLPGVVTSLEVEDAVGVPAALAELGCWSVAVAKRERRRAAERVRHRVQMLLGVFATWGVLPLAPRPGLSVINLIAPHLDELEAEAAAKGGVARNCCQNCCRRGK